MVQRRKAGRRGDPAERGDQPARGARAGRKLAAADREDTDAAVGSPPEKALAEERSIPRDEDAIVALEEKERTPYDGDTAIKLYLREIGQVKLLTPAEEVELAARIRKGDKKAREQMIKALHDQESVFEPETRYKYSNLGMAILGEIVAAASGMSYDAFVTKNILEPLGMASTSVHPREALRGRWATGYDRKMDDGS
ncbi:MAG TPA: serine hydrolase, partial [Candidatus Paceibacterota bacterium]|nr:serine hydrolase [Candidatus Paceibacterota bacterium]